jgi:hypothetical protein
LSEGILGAGCLAEWVDGGLGNVSWARRRRRRRIVTSSWSKVLTKGFGSPNKLQQQIHQQWQISIMIITIMTTAMMMTPRIRIQKI